MFYTLAEAVRATGASRSAILAAIEAGRIKAAQNMFGEWQIERGELERLCALVDRGDLHDDAAPPFPASHASALEAELEALISASGNELRQARGLDQGSAGAPAGAPQAAQPLGTDCADVPEHHEDSPRAGWETPAWEQGAGDESLRLDSLENPAFQAASAWDDQIRISDDDRLFDSAPPSIIQRRHIALIAVGLAATIALGWVAGWISQGSGSRAHPPSQAKPEAAAQRAGSEQGAVRSERPERPRESPPLAQAPRKVATSSTAQSAGQGGPASRSNAAPTAVAAAPAAVQQPAKAEPKRIAVPETRPITIDGWTVREVVGGTAVLEGPAGVLRAGRGDNVPGVGRVYSIVRWGNRWIVATSTGLISTP
jgi:hypothetical protein